MNLTEKINDRLDQLSDMMKDGKVKEAARYSLLASGKRLRPKLMLTALKSYGLDEKPYIDLACAIEMIHTYSLIHDDCHVWMTMICVEVALPVIVLLMRRVPFWPVMRY